MNLGNVLTSRGLASEAEEAYRQALDLDPGQSDALNNLSWLLLEAGRDLSEARDLAYRAVALGGPDPYLALDTLGRILLEIGHCQEATVVFETALETAPSGSTARSWVLYGLALAQRDCGHPEDAITTLESALQKASDASLSEAIGAALEALRPQ